MVVSRGQLAWHGSALGACGGVVLALEGGAGGTAAWWKEILSLPGTGQELGSWKGLDRTGGGVKVLPLDRVVFVDEKRL